MHNFLKVEGHDGLVRDPNTQAILNTNKNGFKEYKESVARSEQRDEELNTIKSDLEEVKNLLKSILNKGI